MKRIIVIALLFVGANVLLTIHIDSKVDRTSYISQWTKAGTEDLVETLETEGVIIPAAEHPVYYHPEQGGFAGFLVGQGDEVQVGTPLFEYSSAQRDADRQRLQSEKDTLRREVSLIDEQIRQLEYVRNVSTIAVDDEDSSSDKIVEITIEKEIYDKEREQRRLLEEIDEYDDRIAALNAGREIDVTSDVSGTVKTIQYDLTNPVITIASDTPVVSGAFTETDLAKVKPGMEVSISSDLLGRRVSGNLTKIARYPNAEPSIGVESAFPFEIELNMEELEQDWLDESSWQEEDGDWNAEGAEIDRATDADGLGTAVEPDRIPDTGETEWNPNRNQIDETNWMTDSDESAGTEDLAKQLHEQINPRDVIIPGAQVDVTVITKRVDRAVTVASEQLEKGSYLYVITPTGKIEQRQIRIGLEVDGRSEIVSGVSAGETVVANPTEVARKDDPFITKLHLYRLSLEPVKTERKMDILKQIGVGFTKR
ncbi:hypothetical protein [Bacillus sp. B15-48]|uniref:efflux RND transporter periplasmic adaptor subunit n=1 Tax=Bacillus sp. B15-48 TaxID=1548601 RepID=UPI00193F0467|nr:hypothetical protein [Bacillus sp. B15-48]MBM4761494.1 hypothetical protein [Bacillus sp. B15-48]